MPGHRAGHPRIHFSTEEDVDRRNKPGDDERRIHFNGIERLGIERLSNSPWTIP
jgi:hypothetical protein